MQNNPNTAISQKIENKKDSILSLFVRPFWMVLGYIPVIISARYILKNSSKNFSKWDLIFWLTYFCIITLRYLDFKFLNGETAEGKPATIKDIRIFSIIVLCILLVVYISIKIFTQL